MNAALVPRHPQCYVCKHVAQVEHVSVLLFDEDGQPRRTARGLSLAPAVDYLRSIGLPGTPVTMGRRVKAHAKHIEDYLANPGPIAPVTVEEVGVTRLRPEGPVRWLDLQEQAMEVGRDALSLLAARLEVMEDKEIIAVAKLGTAAASKRADLEAKGRRLNQVDGLLRLAAGIAAESDDHA